MTNRILLATATLLIAGCVNDVVVPAADATGPAVSLTVLGAGPVFSVNASTGPRLVDLQRHDVMTVLASARDPEGVRSVAIQGEVSVSCQSGNLGQLVRATLLVRMPQEPDAGAVPGGTTVDGRFAALNVDVPAYVAHCREGFAFAGMDGSLRATAENAHGARATTPALTFRVQ